MQNQIKNLPKKYFQITDENKRDRMVAYVRLDEVMWIVNINNIKESFDKRTARKLDKDIIDLIKNN